MTAHLLHMTLDQFGPRLYIECVHPLDDPTWLATDDLGEIIPGCWVQSWQDNACFEDYAEGEWQDDPTFPIPVLCIWTGDSMTVQQETP